MQLCVENDNLSKSGIFETVSIVMIYFNDKIYLLKNCFV